MSIRNFIFIFSVLLTITSCKSKKKTVSSPARLNQKVAVKSEPDVISTKKKVISTFKDATLAYIAKYKDISMNEMKVHNIPASITLAQGILESSSGKSELTKKSNNHFGIKCHKGWSGGRTYHDDDEKGECFRVYKNPITSFKDHSEFLVGRKRYAKLFTFRKNDYVKWAKGLSQAGYATDRRYPAKLIGIVEKYNLDKYDAKVLGKSYKKIKVKESNSYIVGKGDTLYSIARKHELTVEKLKQINSLSSNTINIGQVLILK
mgnify:CR=1 FL=1